MTAFALTSEVFFRSGDYKPRLQEKIRRNLRESTKRISQQFVELVKREVLGHGCGGVSPKPHIPKRYLSLPYLYHRLAVYYLVSYLLASVVKAAGPPQIVRVVVPARIGIKRFPKDEDKFFGREVARVKLGRVKDARNVCPELPGAFCMLVPY